LKRIARAYGEAFVAAHGPAPERILELLLAPRPRELGGVGADVFLQLDDDAVRVDQRAADVEAEG
jgi:hypothetical protein